jgi:hypothetical protein
MSTIATSSASELTIFKHFKDLEDPRIERTKKHLLLDIIALAICAVTLASGCSKCTTTGSKLGTPVSRNEKAKASKTSPATVARGDALANQDPDLAEKVRTGEIKPADAHRELHKRKLERALVPAVVERAVSTSTNPASLAFVRSERPATLPLTQ